MVVFLSIRKVMVLAVAGSCCRFCVCDCPTVRVKEVFSTDAILPDTDCSCGTLEVLDRFRSAASWVLGGEKAHTATTRVRPATVVRNTRPTSFIFEPSSDFRPRLFVLQQRCREVKRLSAVGESCDEEFVTEALRVGLASQKHEQASHFRFGMDDHLPFRNQWSHQRAAKFSAVPIRVRIDGIQYSYL